MGLFFGQVRRDGHGSNVLFESSGCQITDSHHLSNFWSLASHEVDKRSSESNSRIIKARGINNFYIVSPTLKDDAEIALHKQVGEKKNGRKEKAHG